MESSQSREPMPKLALAALGVVFGDIGTSPLYALRACLTAGGDTLPSPQAVLGVAFSFGIPMAFSAVQAPGPLTLESMRSSVPPLGWLLMLGNLFWVLAYDTEYAMVDRDDDLKIGIRTSAITLGRFDIATVLLCYAAFLGSWNYAGLSAGHN